MPQTINTNVSSLNAQRNLTTSQNSLATSMQRLSSGLRVNSAKDDAAGLAIADRMNAQVRGINVAIRNANDGISLAQTAEGALATVTDALQRMRELAVQAQNGSNGTSDRANLDAEYQQLSAEIARIATQTKFNGIAIVGAGAGAQTFQVGANNGDTLTVTTTAVSGVGGGLTTAAAASTALAAIDTSLDVITTNRATYGAAMSRFEFAISEPAHLRREPVGRPRPDHGRRLRGRDRRARALADPAAGRHRDGGPGQPGAAAGAATPAQLIAAPRRRPASSSRSARATPGRSITSAGHASSSRRSGR